MKKSVNCPVCQSKHVIKKGTARLKFGSSQIYLCKDCGKKFRENRLSHKSYQPKVITTAITYYNLGNTIEETVKLVNRRFKVKTVKSTIHGWIKEFADVCTYHRIRDRDLPPDLGPLGD